jgi:glycosyltransferase involved in cell wall biosynthesis
MRLAVVMSSMSAGGAQRVAALLCDHWAARGEDVCLITLDSVRADRYPLDERVTRVGLDMTGEARSLADAVKRNRQRVLALRRVLREFRTTVVLSFGDQTNVLAVLATRGTLMRCVVGEVTDPGRHPIGAMWSTLRRLTYPFATALVVQTRALLPWANAVMLGRRRAYVVRNPVRVMHLPLPRPCSGARGVIVAMGRLAPEKGFDVLLSAFSSLLPDFGGWRLVILGEGPERAALLHLAESLGIANRVSLPGWSAEPAEALASADIFVLSSRYEGFPNALLEAMACGLPVISTDCIGSREIIEHQSDGLLVPIDSDAQLAAAMRRLMADAALRMRLGAAAQKVRSRFCLEAVIREWDSLLLGRAAPTASHS